MSAAGLRDVKRLADSLVVLAAARETAGWARVATVDEINEISAAAAQAIDQDTDATELIKAETIRDLARAQREIARNSHTKDGRFEAEGIADWLDEHANRIDPRRLEGAHP